MQFSLSEAIGAYSGVIFDLDGTLCDLPVDWPAVRAELAEYSSRLAGTRQPVRGIRESLDAIEAAHGFAALRPAFEIIARFESAAVQSAKPHSDRLDAARACLDRGQRLGICSSNMCSTVEDFLTVVDLKDGFEYVVGGDSVRRRKPHPEGLCRIVGSWRLEPGEVAYVADGDHEVRTAAQIGVHIFQV